MSTRRILVLLSAAALWLATAPVLAADSQGKDENPNVSTGQAIKTDPKAMDSSALRDGGKKGVYCVTAFGAKGDSKTDDTASFQKALDAAAKDGGGIVFVPTGNYMIKSHLAIPEDVALEGTFQAPTNNAYSGSTLLAVEGKGDADGEAFIVLRSSSTLKGIAISYPEQDNREPVPYPWTIRSRGDNCSIVNVLVVNPWQAVDFGNFGSGRHFINGLYGQPLHTGIYVDRCADVGRIQNVHFWPFWSVGLKDYMAQNATAFIFGRTDWEFVDNCFCIFYRYGFRFGDFGDGPGNVVITKSGSDIGPTAVLVENCQTHAGIVWTNCQFMAGIDVRKTNTGPVKFSNCGFWGIETTTNHAKIRGSGQVIFNECHFTGWDQKNEGQPAIFADGIGLTVSSCDFMDADHQQIALGENSRATIIMGNRLRGGAKIENQSKGKVEIGLNVEE